MQREEVAGAGFFLERHDFSVILGGPLYQLFLRAHLAGTALELLRRRVVVITLAAWLPLFVLSMAEGHLWGGGVKVPFFRDIEVQARFLLALPLLVIAELVVHQRMRSVIRQFFERDLIPEASRTRFEAAIASAYRLRNSVLAEILLIIGVYGLGVLVIWRHYVALNITSWYSVDVEGVLRPSLAGWWYGCLSLPLFQFILLRWYFRVFVWARFLWQVARSDLSLVPTHPDRAGGLGFLTQVARAFAPLLLAQGVLISGTIANQVFFDGANLLAFKVEIVAVVAIAVAWVVAPLLVFVPHLAAAKRIGLREYGVLAQRYVKDFDQKWIRGGAPEGEPLVGSADIQSLADLGNSFDVIREMRLVPFSKETVIELAVFTLLPVLPLTLTLISFEELLTRALKVVF
ncbi:MAG: hypothetical protein AUH76_14300 [Candidatus Rokubacteria bacterium 13_1_40CM_4_67_11]|nr:MAG: hypothetical protein AUH76_14300 [Candidatus Rokubacteria bacterium 13_1_40CM_4_67_11]